MELGKGAVLIGSGQRAVELVCWGDQLFLLVVRLVVVSVLACFYRKGRGSCNIWHGLSCRSISS